jgi:hypothetical protein
MVLSTLIKEFSIPEPSIQPLSYPAVGRIRQDDEVNMMENSRTASWN